MKISAFVIFIFLFSWAVAIADEDVDLKAIYEIKDEAFRNGKVMDHLFYLTDINGPRLSGSPQLQKAAEWAVSRALK